MSLSATSPQTLEFLFQFMPWVLLVLWTLYSLILVIAPKWSRAYYNYYVFVSIPNVFVTLGILGTFSGIVYGLMNLELAQIKDSLPLLIDGLYTAFYTSIYGIVWSIITRKPVAYWVSKGVVKEPPGDEQRTIDAIHVTLLAIKDHMVQQTAVEAKRHDLQQVEIRVTRAQMNTNVERVVETVKAMSERMAEASSDAMMKALQDVITDFNEGFRHYMGDLVEKNFDKLTDAVDQLIAWQTAYRDDITTIRDAYTQMLEKFETVVVQGERWVDVMDSIAGQGTALQQVVDEFNLAFADSSKFRATLDRIHEATQELKQGAVHMKDLGQHFDGAAKSFNSTQQHVDKWSASAEKVAGMVADLQSTLVQLKQFDIAQVPVLEESFMKRLTKTMQGLDDLLASHVKTLQNRS